MGSIDQENIFVELGSDQNFTSQSLGRRLFILWDFLSRNQRTYVSNPELAKTMFQESFEIKSFN